MVKGIKDKWVAYRSILAYARLLMIIMQSPSLSFLDKSHLGAVIEESIAERYREAIAVISDFVEKNRVDYENLDRPQDHLNLIANEIYYAFKAHLAQDNRNYNYVIEYHLKDINGSQVGFITPLVFVKAVYQLVECLRLLPMSRGGEKAFGKLFYKFAANVKYLWACADLNVDLNETTL